MRDEILAIIAFVVGVGFAVYGLMAFQKGEITVYRGKEMMRVAGKVVGVLAAVSLFIGVAGIIGAIAFWLGLVPMYAVFLLVAIPMVIYQGVVIVVGWFLS